MKRLVAVRRESPLRESCDARQDLVGRFRPDERAGGGVVLVEKLPNRPLEVRNVAMHAATQLPGRQLREPSLHQIQPGAVGEVAPISWTG